MGENNDQSINLSIKSNYHSNLFRNKAMRLSFQLVKSERKDNNQSINFSIKSIYHSNLLSNKEGLITAGEKWKKRHNQSINLSIKSIYR